MANNDQLESGIDRPFRFKRRPIPIAAELRPDWKISTLLLILQLSSRGGKSSLKRLHILNWTIRSPHFRAEFESSLKNPLPLFRLNVRFEPSFSRAIDLAVGQGLVEWIAGNRLQITGKGRLWVEEISKDDNVMRQERDFLTRLGKSVTEEAAQAMFSTRGVS